MTLRAVIVGATGAVGRELVRALEERDFPVQELLLFASEKGAGERLEFRGDELTVRALGPGAFAGAQLAFFATGPQVAREQAPLAVAAGALVIDLSGAFALDDDVPLVVPEVDAGELVHAFAPDARRLVACPDAVAAQLALVLRPLRDAAGLERAIVSTYEAVSGAGQRGVEELESQSRALFNLGEIEPKVFPHRVAFNLLPAVGAAGADGATQGEATLVAQTRKLLAQPGLLLSATRVRVPVFFCHAAAVTVKLHRALAPEEARDLLRRAPGVKVVDDLAEGVYPMPVLAAGDDGALVGRVRADASDERSLSLFVVADNLRRGAAVNAAQIAERWLRAQASRRLDS